MVDEFRTNVVSIHTRELFEQAVAQTAECLERGQAVALPTETVYGLAVNALDAAAVRRVFSVKGRPSHNPIIVHVVDRMMARGCVKTWPRSAENLARAFWPGPLTLVLPKAERLPSEVTAGGTTVGIRWPAHPFIQAVIRRCGFPLAAPSANRSSETSPTCAAHVLQSLAGRIPLIVDGGACNVGIESTVVDLTVHPARVLRPGMVHAPALAAIVGEVESCAIGMEKGLLKSPGLTERHYAPRTPVLVALWRDDRDLEHQLRSRLPASGQDRASPTSPLFRVCVIAHSRVPSNVDCLRVSVVPHEPVAYARALYAELHACDELEAELILVEAVPNAPEWQGIADRLRRAASSPGGNSECAKGV